MTLRPSWQYHPASTHTPGRNLTSLASGARKHARHGHVVDCFYPLNFVAGHGYDVRDVAVSADNSKFASAGGDRQLFLWDVATGQTIRKFAGHDGVINSVSMKTDNMCCYGTSSKFWHQCHLQKVHGCALARSASPGIVDSTSMLKMHCLHFAKAASLSLGSQHKACTALQATATFVLAQVAFSPNNEVIATGGYDQAVKLWDTRSRAHQALQVARPFADSVTSVTITSECAVTLSFQGAVVRVLCAVSVGPIE